MVEQVFSDDQDVLPEGEPVPAWQVGCLGLLAYKLGCLLIMLVLFGVAMVFAWFIG